MSKSKVNTLSQEISVYWKQSLAARNEWYFVEQMLQLIDREKITVLNRYRKAHGEPELVPEPVRYPGIEHQYTTWIVDVPKEWINLISKIGKS